MKASPEAANMPNAPKKEASTTVSTSRSAPKMVFWNKVKPVLRKAMKVCWAIECKAEAVVKTTKAAKNMEFCWIKINSGDHHERPIRKIRLAPIVARVDRVKEEFRRRALISEAGRYRMIPKPKPSVPMKARSAIAESRVVP